jgi:hypothetical protein
MMDHVLDEVMEGGMWVSAATRSASRASSSGVQLVGRLPRREAAVVDVSAGDTARKGSAAAAAAVAAVSAAAVMATTGSAPAFAAVATGTESSISNEATGVWQCRCGWIIG